MRASQKSIDYAVMEKTDRAAVVTGNFRWSDIGSWDALFDITPRDPAGNVLQGAVVSVDSNDCVVHSHERLTAERISIRRGYSFLTISRTGSRNFRRKRRGGSIENEWLLRLTLSRKSTLQIAGELRCVGPMPF
jgi:hypothetical protein